MSADIFIQYPPIYLDSRTSWILWNSWGNEAVVVFYCVNACASITSDVVFFFTLSHNIPRIPHCDRFSNPLYRYVYHRSFVKFRVTDINCRHVCKRISSADIRFFHENLFKFFRMLLVILCSLSTDDSQKKIIFDENRAPIIVRINSFLCFI